MIALDKNRIVICKAIKAPAQAVWEVVTDTRLWPAWGPSILAVDFDDRHIQSGSQGRVKTIFSFWLPFTVVEFRPVDFWRWRIGPFQATGHRISPTGSQSCRLCFDMAWWAAAYLPVCWFALLKIDKIAARGKQL